MRSDIDITLSRLAQPRQLSRTRQAPNAMGRKGGADVDRLKQAAREFEALFLEQMVREMRDATPKSDLFGREKGEEIFQEMLDGEFVRLMTEAGGIGLANFILRSLAEKGITR